MTIIELDAYRPQRVVKLGCQACDKRWIAVVLASVPDSQIECPYCNTLEVRSYPLTGEMAQGIDYAELKRRKDEKGTYDLEVVETVKAGVTAMRVVQYPLEKWYQRGTLDDADDKNAARRRFEAGEQFRALYEARSQASGMQFDGTPPPESFHSRTPPQKAIEASAEFAITVRALGVMTSTLLITFCCHGVLPYLKKHKDRVKQREIGKVIMALDRLAEHWNM